jgi:hypothetical protein
MHDGAFTGVSLIDNVGNASDIVGGAKGTVYNIAGFMMNMIKKANVKDKNRVRERFILHNIVSMAEANDDSRLVVTCVVDDREYKTGALIRPGINFFTFAMNVEALYKVNLTPDFWLLGIKAICQGVSIQSCRRART